MRNQPSVWREKREDKQLIHREELNGAADTNAKTLHGDGKLKKKTGNQKCQDDDGLLHQAQAVHARRTV